MNKCTASAFQQWVFDKTNPNFCEHERNGSTLNEVLELGRYTHQVLASDVPWLVKTKVARINPSNWKLIYADPHDNTFDNTLTASGLIVENRGLQCRPDAVFKNTVDGKILIIERKTTARGSIPDSAWPNNRAQLWCYAWIDEWLDAPEVYLVCQFLKRRIKWDQRKQNKTNPWIAEWESRPSWLRSDRSFNKEIIDYFLEFGGTIGQNLKEQGISGNLD